MDKETYSVMLEELVKRSPTNDQWKKSRAMFYGENNLGLKSKYNKEKTPKETYNSPVY